MPYFKQQYHRQQWLAAVLLILLLPSCMSATTLSSPTSSSSSSIVKTKIYIDTIAGYSLLSACAVGVLSNIVRDEYSGCPDSYMP